ncbi:FecR domain-containing protein [Achromobacter sp. AONIH1]|uniref:FecR family protein n=1 Tax=Achromobacter sp. AONIH1 TaxID=1758194 RepID=UPI0018F81F71|nr:FecR domain-containing protein [Achromobacter sp. AONIH1]
MSAADARGRQASLAEQASRWVVRRSGQPLAPEAQAEFDAWYQADIRHAEAYERLARIWRRMGDIDQARLAKRPARGRKATVAALLIAATAWPVWQFSRDAHPGADYASGNALRVVELPDGSSVTLDAESAIALDYAAGKRVVRLLAGRALFEAAPAAQGGPAFTVTTPDASATALGTRYTVERQEHGTRVAVYEHRVQVHCRICADDRADILDSGDSVQVSADGIVRVASSSEAAPDWSQGLLSFNDVALPAAAAQLSRYTSKRVLVLGQAARNARISGTARLADPKRALELLLAQTRVRITDLPGLLLLR